MKIRLFFWSVIAVVNISVIITAGEIYARITHGAVLTKEAIEAAYRRPDFELHHSLVPGGKGRSISDEWDVLYSINSFGLRDHEYQFRKPKDTFRILVLGDSFTEGVGVKIEDTFVKVLEEKLNETTLSKRRYEVINAGVLSYSPLLEYLYLVKRGLLLEPDMVVLCYDFTDIRDDYEYERASIFTPLHPEGKPRPLGQGVTGFTEQDVPIKCIPWKRVRAFSLNPFERFLIRHSRFYLYIENRINNFLYKVKSIGLKQYIINKIKRKEHDVYLGRNFEVDIYFAFIEKNEEIMKNHWRRNERYIDLIYKTLRQKEIPLVLVTYPYPLEVSTSEWQEGRKRGGFELDKVYPEPLIVNYLKEYAEKKSISFINLYPYFKETDLYPLYFSLDFHFNKNGHRVAGEALFNEFRNKNIGTGSN